MRGIRSTIPRRTGHDTLRQHTEPVVCLEIKEDQDKWISVNIRIRHYKNRHGGAMEIDQIGQIEEEQPHRTAATAVVLNNISPN